MQRVTVSLDDELLVELDRFAETRGYANRSEAVRDLVRGGLQQLDTGNSGDRECVATLMYVYDHHARELASRLTNRFHGHHHLALATMHVHLDHDSCLELAVLRGPAAERPAVPPGKGCPSRNRQGPSHGPARYSPPPGAPSTT